MPYESKRAVDGSTSMTNRWLSTKVPAWLEVDLQDIMCISRWVLKGITLAGWKSPEYDMNSLNLEVSNTGGIFSSEWVTVDAVDGNTIRTLDRSFRPINCRYVRVYVTRGLNTNPAFASCQELEIYGERISVLLRALSISDGSLNPSFNKGTFTYDVSVSNAVSSIKLTPTAEQATGFILVNGTHVISGNASSPINLAVGNNTIKVEVGSMNVTKMCTYTINVTRPKSSNADLSNLAISSGTLTPSFASGTLNYSATVGGNIGSINVTPIAADAGATITVNGTFVQSRQATTVNLTGAATSINIVVTAQDGVTKKNYTLSVAKPQNSSYLTNLVANVGGSNVVSVFTKTTTNYNASVGYDGSSIIVTPTVEDPTSTAVININGTTVTSGQPAGLNVGTNTITVIVTAATRNSTVYTLTVIRSVALTGISAIVVGGLAISLTPPTFDKTTLSYVGTIEYSNASFTTQDVEITPTASAGVVIKYNGNAVSSGTPVKITPAVGANDVNFVVSALDGTGQVTYTVAITRKNSTYLSKITTTKGSVLPSQLTKGSSFSYSVKAGLASSTTITFTAEDASSTITLVTDSGTYSQPGTISYTPTVSSTVKTVTVTISSDFGIISNVYTISVSK